MTRLSVGVLTADLGHLADELSILAGTDHWAHVDVMDGHFCPTITAGPPLVKAVAAAGVTVDAHLLVDEPRDHIGAIAYAGAAVITVPAETTHLHRTLTELAGYDVVRGVGLNPGTPVEVLEPVIELVDLVVVLAVDPGWRGQAPAVNTARRVVAVRTLAARASVDLQVCVDGGVTLDNAAQVAGWGADIVVSGSAIYDGKDPAGNLGRMTAALSTRRSR